MMVASGLMALLLATVHLFAGKLELPDTGPHRRWLSAAAGTSVTYVFLHLLPELGAWQVQLEIAGRLDFLQRHLYLMTLLGLGVFYGLEWAAARRTLQRADQSKREGWQQSRSFFWIHIGAFMLYNGLIGYLLLRRDSSGLAGLMLFTLALGLHFFTNDRALRRHHHEWDYHNIGRWLLAAAVLVGWGVSILTNFQGPVVQFLFAFVTGSLVLNVLKEELPGETRSHFGWFALAAVIYAILLLLAV